MWRPMQPRTLPSTGQPEPTWVLDLLGTLYRPSQAPVQERRCSLAWVSSEGLRPLRWAHGSQQPSERRLPKLESVGSWGHTSQQGSSGELLH